MACRHRWLSSLWLPVLFGACTQDSKPTSPGTEPAAASVEISGARAAQAGESVSLSAAVKDSSGALIPGALVAWSSSDSSLIEVSASGTVNARRIGTVVLTASSGAVHDTVIFTSSLTPYTFLFADTASPADRQLIRDAVQNAHAFQMATFGKGLTDSTTIFGGFAISGCANPGASAFAGGRTITVCLGNQGWKVHKPVIRQKILQHELFHLWQFKHWSATPATSAAWVMEGSAELVAYRGIVAKGFLAFETGLGCQVKESADFASRNPPGLPALSSVEGLQAFQSTQGPLYTHSMLAMNFLTTAGGLTTLRAYGDSVKAGASWQAAFTSAFGKSPATFYGEFPGYLAGLTVPPAYLCGI